MVAYVNILAFFKVVASSQICPHLFEGAKIIKKSDMQITILNHYDMIVQFPEPDLRIV